MDDKDAEADAQGEQAQANRGDQLESGQDGVVGVGADAVEYEAFLTSKLLGMPGLSRTVSHQTMKRIKG